jgi:CRISPR-associated protein Cmr4
MTAKTNMHIGSGDSDLGVIDNRVQRDVLNNYPTIFSSSLKGALREHFESRQELEEEEIKVIFGGSGESKDDMSAGQYKIFAGNLLSYPVRSTEKPFYRAITLEMVEEFLNYIDVFGIEFDKKKQLKYFCDKIKEQLKETNIFIIDDIDVGKKVIVEDDLVDSISKESIQNLSEIEKIFGENLVIYSSDAFKKLMENLPVIARNKLVGGKSENLWYEEIIPRETKFYFSILDTRIDDIENELFEKFNNQLLNGIVQIGANASIGQGYTKIERFGGSDEQNQN